VKRGQVKTAGAAFAPSLLGAPEYREAMQAAAVREAFAERAAIIEHDGRKPRATAERWARACIERVPGAVAGLTPEAVRRLVAAGALGRAP
jgi:hypothetical protein